MYKTDEHEQLLEQLRIWAMEDPQDFEEQGQEFHLLVANTLVVEDMSKDQFFGFTEEMSHNLPE